MIYFTADTHFGSQRTLELSKRPFRNTKRMDEYLVYHWNSIVGSEDTVYHLGDFGDYSIRPRLNGHINLILGNYDEDYLNKYKNDPKMIQKMTSLFDHVYSQTILKPSDLGVKTSDIDKIVKEFYLIHRPNDCIKGNSEIFNLFGHIHGRQMIKRYGIDVGVDCNHFNPISAETIIFYANAIVNNIYDSNVYD